MSMYIEIQNPDNLSLDDFVNKIVIPTTQDYIINSIDNKKLIAIDEYLNLFDLTPYKKTLNAKDIIIQSMYNLTYIKQQNNNYIVQINQSAKVPYTDLTLSMMARLINYGTINTPAYPIFERGFEYVANEIPILYNEYVGGI